MNNSQNTGEQFYFKNQKLTSETINSTQDLLNTLNFGVCSNIIDHDVDEAQIQWPWGYIAGLSEAQQLENQQIQNDFLNIKPEPQQKFEEKQKLLEQNQSKQQKDQAIQELENQESQTKLQTKISKKWIKKMDLILKTKIIKHDDHNRNMPPFFVRIWTKFLEECKDQFNQDQQGFYQLQQELNKIKLKKKASCQDLKNLLGGNNSLIHRKALQRIIKQKLKSQIILSKSIQSKFSYVLCSKIYSLRCKSKFLIGRVQSK